MYQYREHIRIDGNLTHFTIGLWSFLLHEIERIDGNGNESERSLNSSATFRRLRTSPLVDPENQRPQISFDSMIKQEKTHSVKPQNC